MRRNRRCGHQAVHDDSRMAKNKCDGPKDSDIQKSEKETAMKSKLEEEDKKGFEVGREG